MIPFLLRKPAPNHVLYAPPIIRDGQLYRGVVGTDNPKLLLPEIVREKWVISFFRHGAYCPRYHPEIDFYQIDPSFSEKCTSPQVNVIARDFTDPKTFRPLKISKQFDVIFNATWRHLKRPYLMLDALKYSQDKGRPITCLWFGYHWHKEGLKIEKKIKLLANRYQLPITFEPTNFDAVEINYRYNNARLAVICSTQEASPRVLSEAMLAGLPYVTTADTAGGSPAFINNQNGRLSDPTPQALAETIWHVLDHLDSYNPRAWALEHMCLPLALDRLGHFLGDLSRKKGWLINTEALSFNGIDWGGEHRTVQNADAACKWP